MLPRAAHTHVCVRVWRKNIGTCFLWPLVAQAVLWWCTGATTVRRVLVVAHVVAHPMLRTTVCGARWRLAVRSSAAYAVVQSGRARGGSSRTQLARLHPRTPAPGGLLTSLPHAWPLLDVGVVMSHKCAAAVHHNA